MTIDEAISLGIQHHSAGELQQAEQIYRQILQQVSDHPDALHLLGLIAQQVGRLDAAQELIERAIAIAPAVAMYHSNLAEIYRLQRKYEQSESTARKAIELEPTLGAAYVNLAAVLIDLERGDEAETFLRQGVKLDSSPAMAHTMLGNLLLGRNDIQGAIEHGRSAIDADPKSALAHNNLGAALESAGLVEEAVDHYRRSLELLPDCPEFLTNLGTAVRKLGRFQEAMQCWSRAIEIKPDYVDSLWNMALGHLAQGDFERGWPLYEWRFKYKLGRGLRREYLAPTWEGSDLRGKTILLYPEQGYGDIIMFARFIPQLAAMGGRVIAHVPPEMMDLISTVQGVSEVASSEKPPPRFDTYQALLSVPRVLKVTLENLPSNVPYIRVDETRKAQWASRMAGRQGCLRIGLVWAGRPTHQDDLSRSISLELLSPLLDLPDTLFFSLQKGEAASQLADLDPSSRPIDLGGEIHDFSDAAAVIANLDLLISVDTAPAHLAGALGARVWTLLPRVCDFRWMLDREDSPWYPTMRLFRQQRRGDWPSVVMRVREELMKLTKS